MCFISLCKRTGHENGEAESVSTAHPPEDIDGEKKNVGKVLQMQGVEEGEFAGGYVILNEEEA